MILEELSRQIPVLVGGMLAVVGGIGSQVVIHFLAVRRDALKIKRECLESLVKAIYAHAQWLDEKKTQMIFRKEDHDAPAPLDEARMLQALYFPELSLELAAVQQATLPMIAFIHDQRLKHMKDRNQFIAEWDDKPYHIAYQELLASTNTLVRKARYLLAK